MVSIQQAAIDKALAARKAILTTYWSKNLPHGPISTLSHCSKAKDRQNSFFIFLSPSSSTIIFDKGVSEVAHLKPKICSKKATTTELSVMGLNAQEAGGSLVHMQGAQVSKI